MTETVPIELTRSRSSPRLATPDQDEQNARPQEKTSRASQLTPPPIPDDPPDGGYGWVCVTASALINAHSWGINSSYGIFLSYYLTHNVIPNTSPLAYAFIGGLSISQAMLTAPLATWTVHRYGTKVCLHIGIFLQTLSLIGASFARQKYSLILAQGLCFGYGMGFLFVGSVGIAAQWFSRRRSVANAIAAAGSGFGGLVYSLGTQAMIDSVGLGWAFRILGIVSCAVNLICANLLKDRNRQVGARHTAFDRQLLKRPEFCLLQGWCFFSMLGYVVVIFSLPDYTVSVGLSAKQGSIIAALLNVGQMVGRPIIGIFSDRFGRLNLATFLTFACAIFCFAFWIPAKEMGLLSFFAIVGGSVAGTLWATISPVCAEVTGLQDLPAGLSITWLLMVPPTTVAEAIALELRKEGSGNVYIDVQLFTAFMYLGATLCLWLVRGWKVGEIEELARVELAEGAGDREIKRAEKDAEAGLEVRPGRGHEVDGNRIAELKARSWKGRDLLRRLLVPKRV